MGNYQKQSVTALFLAILHQVLESSLLMGLFKHSGAQIYMRSKKKVASVLLTGEVLLTTDTQVGHVLKTVVLNLFPRQ